MTVVQCSYGFESESRQPAAAWHPATTTRNRKCLVEERLAKGKCQGRRLWQAVLFTSSIRGSGVRLQVGVSLQGRPVMKVAPAARLSASPADEACLVISTVFADMTKAAAENSSRFSTDSTVTHLAHVFFFYFNLCAIDLHGCSVCANKSAAKCSTQSFDSAKSEEKTKRAKRDIATQCRYM